MSKVKLVHVNSTGKGYRIVGIDKPFETYNDVRKYCHSNRLTIAKRTVNLKNGNRKDVPAKYTRGAV